MPDDLYFVLIAQLGHPTSEGWRVHSIAHYRASAEAKAWDAERAPTVVDGVDVTDKVVTITKVVARDDLAEMVGERRAQDVEAVMRYQAEKKRKKKRKKKEKR